MRICLDATSLLGPRSGIGVYTHELLRRLPQACPGDEIQATAITVRGGRELTTALPPGVRPVWRPAPARALHSMWMRSSLPPIELFTGKVDIFHGTNFVCPPSRSARGVVTIHDLAYLKYPETVAEATLAYAQLVPAALERGASVCAVSETVADEIRNAYSLSADRVWVTPNGVDASWFQLDEPTPEGLPTPLPKRYVVALGTVEPRKNLQLLVDAYRIAGSSRGDLPPLVLVGSSGWGPPLDLDGISAGRIVRLGRLNGDVVRQVVRSAAALAFPSRYEGFGLPPLEALASGVGVLAADIPVCREVLGAQARFLPVDAPEAWADALFDLSLLPGTVATRQHWARRFTWDRTAELTAGLYHRIAAQG